MVADHRSIGSVIFTMSIPPNTEILDPMSRRRRRLDVGDETKPSRVL